MMDYDIAIAYRIYPKISKIPAAFPDNKYELSHLCLSSLKESLGSLKVKIWVLLDNCPEEYEKLFKVYFSEAELQLVRLSGIGNQATFDMQIKILLEQEYSKCIYFAEDDYFYLPNQFESMLTLIKDNSDVDFISPYDHLDYYTSDLHQQKEDIKMFGGKHWRTAGSTCMTFLTTKETLAATQDIFRSYVKGNYDASLWMSLTKSKVFDFGSIYKYYFEDRFLFDVVKMAWQFSRHQILFGKKYSLWIPIPSAATHMESQYLAPTIDWGQLLAQKISENHSLVNK
jgi:hypothetical protein